MLQQGDAGFKFETLSLSYHLSLFVMFHFPNFAVLFFVLSLSLSLCLCLFGLFACLLSLFSLSYFAFFLSLPPVFVSSISRDTLSLSLSLSLSVSLSWLLLFPLSLSLTHSSPMSSSSSLRKTCSPPSLSLSLSVFLPPVITLPNSARAVDTPVVLQYVSSLFRRERIACFLAVCVGRAGHQKSLALGSIMCTLTTLTSLNKEVGPFFLSG